MVHSTHRYFNALDNFYDGFHREDWTGTITSRTWTHKGVMSLLPLVVTLSKVLSYETMYQLWLDQMKLRVSIMMLLVIHIEV